MPETNDGNANAELKTTKDGKIHKMKAVAPVAGNTVKRFAEGTLTRVPLAHIVKSPDIIYRDLNTEWVDSLSKSIEDDGLQAPLLVWNGGGERGQIAEIGEGDSARKVPASFLVAGSHRYAALKAFFKRNPSGFREKFQEGIPVMVLGGTVQEVLTAQLRENLAREEMAPEQVFPVIKRLMAKEAKGGFGMKQKEVAVAICKSTGWVSQILSIEENLGEEAIEALKKKDITLSEAREASAKVKKDKKAGKDVDVKAELQKVKDKTTKRKEAGKEREAKRVTAKTLYKRFLALPKMKHADTAAMLLNVLAYLAADDNAELPEELSVDVEKEESDDDSE